MRSIALMGRARSGKDTAAAFLVDHYWYTRVAFADPVKEMALDINPVISYERGEFGWGTVPLAVLVDHVGWERAKDEYPEVRRVLQQTGQTVRKHDPDFWVNTAFRKIDAVHQSGGEVVVTDCRYPNEYEMLRRNGFSMVRIERPGVGQDSHESETALSGYPADFAINNSGTLARLRENITAISAW